MLSPAPNWQPPSASSCLQSPGHFRRLAGLLDCPLLHFTVAEDLEALRPISDAALCVGVMLWAHLAFHVAATVALAAVLQHQRAQRAQREVAAGSSSGEVSEDEWGHSSQGLAWGDCWGDTFVMWLGATMGLWCVVRTATILLL